MRFGNKYGAKKTVCRSCHKHDSKAESAKCDELAYSLSRGEISSFAVHCFFPFEIDGKPLKMANGHKAGITVDFVFKEDGKKIAADVKGFTVRDFPLRWALAKALYPDWEWRIYK